MEDVAVLFCGIPVEAAVGDGEMPFLFDVAVDFCASVEAAELELCPE